jgi:hypothetical protein
VWAGLFFVGYLDFELSTKISLYGVSIWLNGWVLAWVKGWRDKLPRLQVFHDCLSLWLISYAMTNLLWEVPWVIFSSTLFQNLDTLEAVNAQSKWARSSVWNMWWWVLASFSSVDLRTVNHDGTFYSLEILCFTNVASTLLYFYLNKKQSVDRYVIAVVWCGQPIAATFIFSFSEVFDNYKNMPGGVADTLLALVWTQYQYFFFPMITGSMAVALLRADWRSNHEKSR